MLHSPEQSVYTSPIGNGEGTRRVERERERIGVGRDGLEFAVSIYQLSYVNKTENQFQMKFSHL